MLLCLTGVTCGSAGNPSDARQDAIVIIMFSLIRLQEVVHESMSGWQSAPGTSRPQANQGHSRCPTVSPTRQHHDPNKSKTDSRVPHTFRECSSQFTYRALFTAAAAWAAQSVQIQLQPTPVMKENQAILELAPSQRTLIFFWVAHRTSKKSDRCLTLQFDSCTWSRTRDPPCISSCSPTTDWPPVILLYSVSGWPSTAHWSTSRQAVHLDRHQLRATQLKHDAKWSASEMSCDERGGGHTRVQISPLLLFHSPEMNYGTTKITRHLAHVEPLIVSKSPTEWTRPMSCWSQRCVLIAAPLRRRWRGNFPLVT